MFIELGHYTLLLAFAIAILQTILPLIGAQRNQTALMAFGDSAARVQFILIAFSFAAVTYAFVTSDFSVNLVYANSHTDKPMIFKISGVWGNHEGSMLLWVLIVALFGAMASWFGKNLPATLRARVLAVQGSIGVAFLGFVIFTSNPFTRLVEPPMNGLGLNPLLQDVGLAFHPPFLYLGYVGLSMAFSFAVAALIEGRVGATWARWVRPWTLAAWIFLTIGIGLGSWWAYYELGWGGFWFWDPVENASLMPWLLSAALLHSAIVVEKRESLKAWTVLLAIMAFGFSLIGTFIVRSGVITSVHAFANDPERGVFILFILAFFVGGALTLFAARASAMQAKGVFAIASRESALVMNNVLLGVAALGVFAGTIWPLLAEILLGRKISVGAPFFNMSFTPIMVLIAILLPLGSIMPWKRARLGRTVKSMSGVFALSLALMLLIYAMQTGRSNLGPIGVFFGTWIILGAMRDLWMRTGRRGNKFKRLVKLPGADWGKMFAHSGLGIVFIGISGLMAWEVEDIRVAEIGDTFSVGGYEITLKDVRREPGPNYISLKAEMQIGKNGTVHSTVYPEKRTYPVESMPTTEAGIDNGIFRDVYLVIGDAQASGGWAVRSYIKPFANWIWTGTIIMAFGGLLSLFDRRYRVAAGTKKRDIQKATT
ncbi:MAG: heme lyase CcmF/NrfE family subunit [Halocynthiibacter sp.]